MKKRVLSLLTCLALLAVCLPSAAAAEPLRFISINDTIPPELINTAIEYNGYTYVPYSLFTNYGFGIYYTYFSGTNTAYLYSSDRQIFFDLSNGKTFDGDDYQYATPAILRAGTAYLPLNFVCSFFGGLSYANIGGNEYGSVLRITSGPTVFTDAELLRYGLSMMRTYYQRYNADLTPGSNDNPAPPAVDPKPKPSTTVKLALAGLPDEESLMLLQRQSMGACVFLDAETVRSQPDMVRRLACGGFLLGADCRDPEADPEEISRALWQATRRKPLLALVPEDAEAPAGMAAFRAALSCLDTETPEAAAYRLMPRLGQENTSLCFPCGGDWDTGLRMVLHHLLEQRCTVTAPRVTDGT